MKSSVFGRRGITIYYSELLHDKYRLFVWMRGGLMVSELAPGSSDLGSSPGQALFTLTVPLSTKVYKWVPVNLMLPQHLGIGSISR